MCKQKKVLQSMKKNFKKISYFIVGFVVISYLIFIGLRMHKWNTHLNSPDRIITVATVYDHYTLGSFKNDADYYEYFYKVEDEIFFGATSVENVNKTNIKNGKTEQFIVVISKEDPTIHCVIWNEKFSEQQKYGEIYNRIIEEKTIRNYTIKIGLSPKSKIDEDKMKTLFDRNLI